MDMLSARSDLFIDPFSLNASEPSNNPSNNQQLAAPTDNNNKTTTRRSVSSQLDRDEMDKLAAFDSVNWLYCFMLDDLCYSVLRHPRTPTLVCPRHGEQNARDIAPDLAFEDIDSSLLISDSSTLSIDSLLGRGSFGSVFSGSLGPHRVAVKVLENLKQVGFFLVY